MNAKRMTSVLLGLALLSQPLFASDKLARKLDNARHAYRELFQEADQVVPRRLLDDAECIAVIPNVIRGAFWVGGHAGKGVLTCRNQANSWSPPIFVKLWGASIGLQFGGKATDLVLFFMTERSAEALLKTGIKIGADASVAAGPQGRSAQVGTNPTMRAEIYSYAKSRGLFAGLALNGARIAPHRKSNDAFYGDGLVPREILFENETAEMPRAALDLIAELP